MGYQPNLEREEYSPPDKKRVSFVVLLVALAVIVALIVYGLFVLAKGMIVVPSERAAAESAPWTLAERMERPLTLRRHRPSPARLSSPKSARGDGRMTRGACPTPCDDFGGES
jgi:hypothetical protein